MKTANTLQNKKLRKTFDWRRLWADHPLCSSSSFPCVLWSELCYNFKLILQIFSVSLVGQLERLVRNHLTISYLEKNPWKVFDVRITEFLFCNVYHLANIQDRFSLENTSLINLNSRPSQQDLTWIFLTCFMQTKVLEDYSRRIYHMKNRLCSSLKYKII